MVNHNKEPHHKQSHITSQTQGWGFSWTKAIFLQEKSPNMTRVPLGPLYFLRWSLLSNQTPIEIMFFFSCLCSIWCLALTQQYVLIFPTKKEIHHQKRDVISWNKLQQHIDYTFCTREGKKKIKNKGKNLSIDSKTKWWRFSINSSCKSVKSFESNVVRSKQVLKSTNR